MRYRVTGVRLWERRTMVLNQCGCLEQDCAWKLPAFGQVAASQYLSDDADIRGRQSARRGR